MATRLEKTLKRELLIDGRPFVVTISPDGLKLTLKGHRKGQELRWHDLVSGGAALAVALNASIGRFDLRRAPSAAADLKAPAPAAAPRRPKKKRTAATIRAGRKGRASRR